MLLGGKPPQLFDQIKDGVVDVAWTLPGHSGSRFLPRCLMARDIPMMRTFKGVRPFPVSDILRVALLILFPVLTLHPVRLVG